MNQTDEITRRIELRKMLTSELGKGNFTENGYFFTVPQGRITTAHFSDGYLIEMKQGGQALPGVTDLEEVRNFVRGEKPTNVVIIQSVIGDIYDDSWDEPIAFTNADSPILEKLRDHSQLSFRDTYASDKHNHWGNAEDGMFVLTTVGVKNNGRIYKGLIPALKAIEELPAHLTDEALIQSVHFE